MAIHEYDFLHLQGSATSLILEMRANAPPIWRHWGQKLTAKAMPLANLLDQLPVPTFALDHNIAPTLFPTFGHGWYGAPALLAHRSGTQFAQDFTRCEAHWVTTDHHVIIKLVDDVAQMCVEIDVSLSPQTDVLTLQTRLTNLGETALDVQYCASACLPLPTNACKVRAYSGRHNHEFQLFEDKLSPATWSRENRRGLTSHDCPPCAVVVSDSTDMHQGPAFGLQLAWSGNHSQRIDALDDGGFQWQIAQWLAPGEVILLPGESLMAPIAMATFSNAGLNGVAHNFHAQARKHVTWPTGKMSPRPVHFNTWEGVYFDLNEQALMDMASGAASLGVERFVLDDGWFMGRRHDRAGLGDWWVDRSVFPDGLHPLCAHVTGLGMAFGLWVEPEMVNPDSEVFRAHPDWVLQLNDRPQLTARNQLVLDLSNPEVFDYLQARLVALLEEYPITYLKWDHNRDLTSAGHTETPAYRNQILNAYRLFNAVRQQFPNVEIEACAGGGGRIDAGILMHTHRFWTSDCIDAVSRLSIQRGFLQFFPPELMGSHIGTSPAHVTGRSQSLGFRAAVAMGGHLGLELDPRCLSDGDRQETRAWVGLYKSLRDTLHSGQIWLGVAGDGIIWQAHGHEADFVLMIYRVSPTAQRLPPQVQLSFLSGATDYRVKILSPSACFDASNGEFFSKLARGEAVASGQWVKEIGFPLPFMKAETALILRFSA